MGPPDVETDFAAYKAERRAVRRALLNCYDPTLEVLRQKLIAVLRDVHVTWVDANGGWNQCVKLTAMELLVTYGPADLLTICMESGQPVERSFCVAGIRTKCGNAHTRCTVNRILTLVLDDMLAIEELPAP